MSPPPNFCLLLTSEERLIRDAQGRVWGPPTLTSDVLLRRYPGVERFTIVARVVAGEPARLRELDDPAVDYLLVPWRLREIGLSLRSIYRAARSGYTPVVTMPGIVGSALVVLFLLGRRPFALEVVGDPDESLRYSSTSVVVRHVVRPVISKLTRLACKYAKVVRYVTAHQLQSRYPPGSLAVTFSLSNVDLHEAVSSGPSRARSTDTPFELITVGSLARPYKRVDLVLQAVAVLVNEGRQVHLRIVGDGRCRPSLEEEAIRLGIGTTVEFTGYLPGASAVATALDKADLFVLASDTEGLPRALIEAMARGLPCVATDVGGARELLSERALVHRGSLDGLVSTLRAFIDDVELREQERQANVATAKRYLHEANVGVRRQLVTALAALGEGPR